MDFVLSKSDSIHLDPLLNMRFIDVTIEKEYDDSQFMIRYKDNVIEVSDINQKKTEKIINNDDIMRVIESIKLQIVSSILYVAFLKVNSKAKWNNGKIKCLFEEFRNKEKYSMCFNLRIGSEIAQYLSKQIPKQKTRLEQSFLLQTHKTLVLDPCVNVSRVWNAFDWRRRILGPSQESPSDWYDITADNQCEIILPESFIILLKSFCR